MVGPEVFITVGIPGGFTEVLPRVRTLHGKKVTIETYEAPEDDEALARHAFETMLHGLSTRNRAVGPEAVGEVKAAGISKSAMSRRFALMLVTQADAPTGRGLQHHHERAGKRMKSQARVRYAKSHDDRDNLARAPKAKCSSH